LANGRCSGSLVETIDDKIDPEPVCGVHDARPAFDTLLDGGLNLISAD